MKLVLFIVFFCHLVVLSQQLDPTMLKDETNGNHFLIRSYDVEEEYGFYLLQSGKSTSNLEYEYLFRSYSVFTFHNKGKICLLEGINLDSTIKAVVNLDQKELIIPPTSSEISYVPKDDVFIINTAYNDSSKIIDLDGKVLYSYSGEKIYTSSLGYYHRFRDGNTRFFDKTGNLINHFSNFSLYEEIDSNNFLGNKLMLVYGDSMDVTVIVNENNEVVFHDKCFYGHMEIQRKNWTNEIEVNAIGFCNMDDSRTLVVKNSKNQWELALEKSKMIEYCYYISDISNGMLLESTTQTINKKEPKYFFTADDLSYILDKKGKVIFTVYAQVKIDDIWIRDSFIEGYLFGELGQFYLIDFNGDLIIQDKLSEEIFLHDNAVDEGYYGFYSKSSDRYFILNSSTLETYSSSEPIPTIGSIEELKLWFPE